MHLGCISFIKYSFINLFLSSLLSSTSTITGKYLFGVQLRQKNDIDLYHSLMGSIRKGKVP